MLTTILIIILLLLLSAFFSGSETALTSSSRPMIHRLEQQGDKRAGIVAELQLRKERLIGAILLGNNLVNILASALATSVMITLFGEAGVVYATAMMTALVLIFSEILPKTYALQNANKMALAVSPILKVIVLIFAPVTHAIEILVAGTLRLFGASNEADDPAMHQEEELRGAIDLHAGDEDAHRHERAMLRSVLDLDDVDVGEIMTHRKNVNLIDAAETADAIVDQVLASTYTRIPLYRDDPDNIVGVIHAKQLLREVRARHGDVSEIDVVALSAEPWFVPDTTTLLDQLQAFRQRREHFAIVIDEYGTLQGIVTLEDILEEIVGEIDDEHDETVAGVTAEADGSYLVKGDVTLRDLNREFEWNLPDDEAATVAGLLLHEARRIPEVGQSFIFHGFRFDVLRKHRNQITQLRLTAVDDTESDQDDG
jgi:Mg2+/Co2+ transporter CorB